MIADRRTDILAAVMEWLASGEEVAVPMLSIPADRYKIARRLVHAGVLDDYRPPGSRAKTAYRVNKRPTEKELSELFWPTKNTVFENVDKALLERRLSEGASQAEIEVEFGIRPSTLRGWVHKGWLKTGDIPTELTSERKIEDRVKDLLTQGMSVRAAARVTGISRQVVKSVQRRLHQAANGKIPAAIPAATEDHLPESVLLRMSPEERSILEGLMKSSGLSLQKVVHQALRGASGKHSAFEFLKEDPELHDDPSPSLNQFETAVIAKWEQIVQVLQYLSKRLDDACARLDGIEARFTRFEQELGISSKEAGAQ